MVPIAYMISYDHAWGDMVTIKAVKFTNDGKPISWAIYHKGLCMSNADGSFQFEPNPSSRSNKFLKEFRFTSLDDAKATYDHFYPDDAKKL